MFLFWSASALYICVGNGARGLRNGVEGKITRGISLTGRGVDEFLETLFQILHLLAHLLNQHLELDRNIAGLGHY